MRRLLVPPPAVTPPSYTLLDYVQWVDSNDPHWQAGVTYEAVCGSTSTTFDYCVVSGVGSVANPTKLETANMSWRGATPFTVYGEIDCSPPGFWDEAESMVAAQFALREHDSVELVFWSGAVSGGAIVGEQMPHLASNAVVLDSIDSIITLQTAATVVTGALVDVVEGLSLLEQHLATCYGGVGMIYVTVPAFNQLVNEWMITREGTRWKTARGNWVVPMNGSPNTGPDGVVAAGGTAWMYATGALMGYRTGIRQVGSLEESFNRSINLLKMTVERTYVLGWDCCHAAVRVSTGGAITGTAASAT